MDQLRAYFIEKGRVLTAEEYKAADDAPYRFQIVKRTAGSWARLISLVNLNGTSFNAAELGEPVEAVLEEAVPEKPAVVKTTGKNG